MSRIAILVAGFERADRLLESLRRIPPEIVERAEAIVVFDDCSADRIADAALSYRQERGLAKLEIFRNRRKRGYGGTQKRGYQYILRRDFDYVAQLDGGGWCAPEKLGEMLAPLEAGEAEMVLGSRMMSGSRPAAEGRPVYAWTANRLLTSMENRLAGLRLTDFHSGYRAYRTSALAKLPLAENSDSRRFDTQVLLEFHARGFRIKEAPAPACCGEGVSLGKEISNSARGLWECANYRLTRWGLWPGARYAAVDPEYEFHDFAGSSHRTILDLLPAPPPLHILDVGTAGGYLDRELRARGHRVTGIECQPERADRARRYCDEMIAGDVETLDLGPYAGSFDCALLGDVLEHLREPEAVLERVAATLKPGGKAIVCVPNVANLYVRLNLLFGRFRYETRGILDATHLRFFTLRTFRELVESSGLEILSVQATPIPLPWLFAGVSGRWWFQMLHRALCRLTRMFLSLLAYQFVAVAEKPAWLDAAERSKAGEQSGEPPRAADGRPSR
ncbi:MAG TPA: bifunctional glycosyltransferase/class I SAM-dependent methyltransferase [Candidatus Acidoferrales bacterium]|nr:bifunctional glycosyltransferase/class I SAM-dependent methyltransferase [Candidatus Acidoferrales bacterium]